MYSDFFWLHIKKVAGTTTRRLLAPHYVQTDRTRNPANFIQSDPAEWNDILNNYRVVLGEYQGKRALFAKTFLYPDTWDNTFSFAFVRHPVDRCVSMFYHLFWHKGFQWKRELQNALLRADGILSRKKGRGREKIHFSESHAFSDFLSLVAEARESNSIYKPVGLHFTTHTAPMWDDITDWNGNVLLTRVYRVEDLAQAINEVFAECGKSQRVDESVGKLNQNTRKGAFTPNTHHMRQIEKLYARDFEIYERFAYRK